MLPIRRCDALCVAILMVLSMAARPAQAVPGGAAYFAAAALAAGAQDDEDFGDEDEFVDEDEFADDEEAVDEEETTDDEDAVDDDDASDEDSGAEGLDDGSAGDAEDGDGVEATADEDVEYIEDYEDDSWAPELDKEILENEEDDAIAFDERYDEDVYFEVEAVEDGGGTVEDTGERDLSDGFAIGQVLQVSGARRGASGGGNASPGDDVPYAFGGRPVAATAVPWQAQIFNPGVARNPANPRPIWMRQHNCGGALIADDWVITAAHCIDQQKVDLGFKVRLGAQDLSQGDGLVYRIERIVRHSQYDAGSTDLTRPPNMYANDIALVHIVPDGPPQRRDPQRIRPIPLNRQPLADGLPVTVTGWGAVGGGATNEGSAMILRVDLRLMDARTCATRPRRAGKVHPKVFCAASPKQATCRGDSGGPVVPTNGPPVLAGLVSWGSSTCGGDGSPGMYTRVDQYIGWIEQAMRLPPTRNHLP
ncbi:MAG: serine protease [Silanimonas sp.]